MDVTAAAARTLYAHWSGTQVVSFEPNGGTCAKGRMVCETGKTYPTFPTPKWTNHAFKGWYTAAVGGERVKAGMDVTAAAARTLYAHWAAAKELSIMRLSFRTDGVRRSARDSASCCILEFEAQEGGIYEIQWTPTLGGEWIPLGRWMAEEDGRSAIDLPIHNNASSGFYRIAVPAGDGDGE
jgi:uncharacterized repeat protein (TIGR02543 family)